MLPEAKKSSKSLRCHSNVHTNKSACAANMQISSTNKIVKQSTHFPTFHFPSISVFPPCGHVSEIANQLCRENGREKRRVGEAVQGHSWSLKCRCEDSLRQLIMRLVVLVALVVPPIRTKTLKSQGNRGGGKGASGVADVRQRQKTIDTVPNSPFPSILR